MTVKQISFYILYFFAAFIFFAILGFPQKTVGKKLSSTLSKLSPAVSIQMESANPIFPPGIAGKGTMLIFGDHQIPIDTFRLHVSILDLFRQEKTIRFSSTLLGGVLNGKTEGVSFSQNNSSRNDFSRMVVNTAGLHFQKLTHSTPDGEVEISFELTGNAICQKENSHPTTKGTMVLTNVITKMKGSILNRMGIDTLEFSNIEIDFLADKQQISISRCIATGNVITLRLKGRLTPGKNALAFPEDGSLDLKGFIQPQPGYLPQLASISSVATLFKNNQHQGIPIQITGSLKAPRISL